MPVNTMPSQRQECVVRRGFEEAVLFGGYPVEQGSNRELARRCRYLEKTGIEPEIIEQLRIWATELAEIAEDSESRAVQPEMAE
jgi:hypothetical protein